MITRVRVMERWGETGFEVSDLAGKVHSLPSKFKKLEGCSFVGVINELVKRGYIITLARADNRWTKDKE